jgi:nickel-dependent lactate racemase
MGIDLPYGGVNVQLEIRRVRVLDIISPSNISPSTQPYAEVERALREPIEGPRIEELAPRDKVIAIAVDDVTRVTPTHILLRSLLKILEKAGAKETNVRIIVALGSHRRITR